MQLLVTGSRAHPYRQQVWDALSLLWDDIQDSDITLLHGACPHPTVQKDIWNTEHTIILRTVTTKGDQDSVDQIAAEFAMQAHWRVRAYPADWNQYNKSAGPRRNREMVNELVPETDICVAFPYGKSLGTRSCIRMAKQAGIDTRVYE